MTSRPALLVVGVGNPSRGDDALGPLFVEHLAQMLVDEIARGEIELLTDFQLQIEHALDLTGRAKVVFVDASLTAPPPFEYRQVHAHADHSHSTHALSPEALLSTHERVAGEPPQAWVLGIRAERFELGDELSERARAHLDAALSFLVAQVRQVSAPLIGRRLELEGIVQGVGLRPFVFRTARRLGLNGTIFNTAQGLCAELFGSAAALDALLCSLQSEAPPAALLRSVRVTAIPVREQSGLRIEPSQEAGPRALSLPPDLATCPECLREIADRSDRHHGYAFTSCVACGPRFSIARALPFDRSATSMQAFAPCAACQREYEAPDDRRFHAQTLACAQCGPRLTLASAKGHAIESEDPIALAAQWLRDGKILAVQGIGAFHLLCDAQDPDVVAELRRRKRRDAQPFAVLVHDLAAAEAVAVLDAPGRAALVTSARPIVLAAERPGTLPPGVNGPSRRTGVLLPYTPIHERLSSLVGRPLVCTSGNPTSGPPVIDRDEALATLSAIADGFLLHNRPIERRVEDSVVASSPRGMRVLRRARGFAPTPIVLPVSTPVPVLAVGGHMKAAACLAIGDLAYLTPHLGDLTLDENVRAFARDVEGFEALLGVRADILAHDLHPEYATTEYALARPAAHRIGVQHHAAHIYAALAELRIEDPVIGVAFDGTGFGLDASMWGAEVLLVDGARWTRACSFRPVPLPGGERAIHEVWRVALGALHDAFGPEQTRELVERLPLFQAVAEDKLGGVLEMLAHSVRCVPARGIGRFFDAVGALCLRLPRARFDSHVALALEESAVAGPVAPYPVTLPQAIATLGPLDARHEVDLRPTIRAVVDDLLEGVAGEVVAARFQQTLIEATASVVTRVQDATGLTRVVLGGGSFQNRALERGLLERLGTSRVLMARDVPINDGGLALGQALFAILSMRTSASFTS